MIAVNSALGSSKPYPSNLISHDRNSIFTWKVISVIAVIIIFLYWYFPVLSYDPSSVMAMFTMFPREWIFSTDNVPQNEKQNKFTLVTYNVLNDRFMRPGTYNYVPKDLLALKDRHPRIMVELQAMKPDIIGMEEVDVDYFPTHLNPSLKSLGYTGLFAADKGSQVGQTLFWKKDKFNMLYTENHLVHDLAKPHIKEALADGTLKTEDEAEFTQWLERRTVILIAHLEHIASKNKVIVAAIHVTWDVLQLPALQTLQVALALQVMRELSLKTGTKAMIIAGDFNTPPDFPAYFFLKNGYLNDYHKQRVNEITDKAGILTPDYRKYGKLVLDILPKVFKHELKLSSAYFSILGEEPDITNADDFDTRMGLQGVKTYCLDYIWYTYKTLGVSGVLKTPSREDILKHTALPSVQFPSDHIPLKAEFYFIT